MKKVLSVLLTAAVMICCLSGLVPGSAARAGAATSVLVDSLDTADGRTIPAAPKAPQLINVFVFGSTYGSSGTKMILDDISKSTAVDIEQYHFIFADVYDASRDEVAAFAKAYSKKIDFCYGEANYFLMWKMLTGYVDGRVMMPVTIFVDSNGDVRDAVSGTMDMDGVLGRIRTILGDRYIEPPKNPAYTDVEIEGYYYTNAQEALDRLNEIRLEACKEGVINPEDKSKRLKMSDYKPLVWNSQLEQVARLRAAEASMCIDHTRPNGKSCFTADNIYGANSSGEVLGWNWTNDMVYAINQFYGEKSDWVNQTGSMTGHYEAIIMPSNRSVGLGAFYASRSAGTRYPSCLCGRFSSAESGFDTTIGKRTDMLKVKVEVETRFITNPCLDGDNKLNVGSKAGIAFWADTLIDNIRTHVTITDDVTWTSSDNKILTVSGGRVTAKKAGTATVTAKTFSGVSASIKITVEGSGEAPGEDYIYGDADCDGEVTVLDATTIQRLLADIISDDSGMIAILGDSTGDGLDILDATLIQRWLVGLTGDDCRVGKSFKLPAM